MKFKRLHYLPGALFLLVMATFFTTYGIAVSMEHVEAGFPYISDTGSIPPESCIFSQFINIAAFLLLLCVYIRHLQVDELRRRAAAAAGLEPFPRWLGLLACAFGAASCLGLSMVANFQETSVLVVHMIGAFVCFFCATIYFCLQTYISRKLIPDAATMLAFVCRLVISLLCIIFTISTIACGVLSMKKFDGDDIKKWRPEHGGWELHLVSAISEWFLVICFCGFIASFSGEFKGLVLEGPILTVPSGDERAGSKDRNGTT